MWIHLACKHHFIYISFYTCLDLLQSHHTLQHSSHNHICQLDIILSILSKASLIKYINKNNFISIFLHITYLHGIIKDTQVITHSYNSSFIKHITRIIFIITSFHTLDIQCNTYNTYQVYPNSSSKHRHEKFGPHHSREFHKWRYKT